MSDQFQFEQKRDDMTFAATRRTKLSRRSMASRLAIGTAAVYGVIQDQDVYAAEIVGSPLIIFDVLWCKRNRDGWCVNNTGGYAYGAKVSLIPVKGPGLKKGTLVGVYTEEAEKRNGGLMFWNKHLLEKTVYRFEVLYKGHSGFMKVNYGETQTIPPVRERDSRPNPGIGGKNYRLYKTLVVPIPS